MRHHVVLGAVALFFIQNAAAGPFPFLAIGFPIAFVVVTAANTIYGVCTTKDKNDIGTDHNEKWCKPGKRSVEDDLLLEEDTRRWVAQMTEKVKRDGKVALPGVPQFVIDQCKAELAAATVTISGPIGNNGLRADGVPPTCMTLATVINGDPVNGPYPIPMGSAALQYNDLTADQYNQFVAIFKSQAA